MALHFPLEKLFAYHDDWLSFAERAALQAHLDVCAFCSANLALLVQAERALQILPAATGTNHASKTACPAPETVGKYITHELPPSEHLDAEKHLAACAECRRRLAEIFQHSIEPVSEEEKKILAALPPFEIMELAPKTEARPNLLKRFGDWIHSQILELLRPRPAWKIAFAVGIIAVIAGYPSFRSWQANRHAKFAVAKLQKIWTITDDELRPADDFQWSLFSQTHSAEETPDTVAIEFREALKWDPDSHTALLGLSTYRCFIGDLVDADSLVALLLERNSQDFAAWNNRGVVSARREDSTDALAAFERALQIRPDYAIAAYNRADLLYRFGRSDEAKTAWQNFLKLDSTSKWAEVARRRLRQLGR